MNWNAFMVVLPINILIIWAIVEDIKEIIKREENERIREANLLRDTIHIDVSEKDLEMLDMNIRRSEFNTRNEYLRGTIKELSKINLKKFFKKSPNKLYVNNIFL